MTKNDFTFADDLKARYLQTDITDFSAVRAAIQEFTQLPNTAGREEFLTALQNANPENVKRAKKYNNMTKWRRRLGWIIMAVFVFLIAVIDADYEDAITTWLSLGFCIGAGVQIYYAVLKKSWKLLTLSGSLIHPALMADAADVSSAG